MRRLLLPLASVLVASGLLTSALVVDAPSTAYAAGAGCGAWSGSATKPLSSAARRQVAATSRQVDAVFEGQVTLPQRATGAKPLSLVVDVVAVWKGAVQAPSRAKVTFEAGPCRTWALAHPSPEDYLFFVTRGPNGTWVASGAAPRVVGRTEDLRAVLGDPAQEPGGSSAVTFTPESTGAPRSYTKVAAPGFALVIIGVLGLLVVRRLGRRG